VTDPVLTALFLQRGGETGPCAGYTPAFTDAAAAPE